MTRGTPPRVDDRVLTLAGIPITPRTARAYFALQAVAGGIWWWGVFASDDVRHATLGDLTAPVIAVLDIPLFVLASALVACGVPWAVWIVAPWTSLVAAGMAVYATITGSAGWGALLMALAALATLAAGIVVERGRAPVEWITTGPFAFRPAAPARTGTMLARTGLQTLIFWGLFLVFLPIVIAALESRWMLRIESPPVVGLIGIVLLLAASALGIWSAVSMSVEGDGTPLPSQTARRLVIAGPYRFVRNPMAIAGIAQGVAVGLLLGSWLVVAYALCGSLFWNSLVRPLEEDDLSSRFGREFDDYRSQVACWVPLRRAASRRP
nr:isoprenylcysteine carboxylmethyltransferase family protein [uncultured Microbacterium sp.]